MLKCLMDPTVPQDARCAYCCIYCSEKEECEYLCELARNCKTGKEVINRDCTFAYDEEQKPNTI